MKPILILALLIFCLSCSAQPSCYDTSYALNIIELTRDELPVYILLDVIHENVRVGTILITNLELAWILTSDMKPDEAFFLEFKKILMNCRVDYLPNLWDDFYIEETKNRFLSTWSVKQLLETFFNETGGEKDNINEEFMKEVVAHLIRRGIIVHQGKYFNYNVYTIPE
jgi:hypothetical protein